MGLLAKSLELRVSSARKGLVWVELRIEGEKEIDDRSGLCESRRCEGRRNRLFEVMQVDVMKYEEKGFDVMVDFNARIG